jgi:hypothetical protein
LRLFGVACCRQIEYRMASVCLPALEVAEQYAEGRVGADELWRTQDVCLDHENAFEAAVRAAEWAVPGDAWDLDLTDPRMAAERGLQACLLRDIVGNPFRPVPALDPGWRSRNGALVAELARSIYDARRFQDLPLLADALADAGCADPELLDHLRGAGVQVRGCWALDLILDRT